MYPMRGAKVILAAVLAMTLVGCLTSGKHRTVAAAPAPPQPAPVAAAPAPPPEPLSVPQTQVQLPPPQPIDPEAMLPPQSPETPPTGSPPSTGRPARRTGGVPQPKPAEPPAAPATTPAAAPPQPEPRPPIQEIVPAAETRRLQDSAQARKREITKTLETFVQRRMSRHQQTIVTRIRGFIKDSDDAEHRGDMREADALAERAQILLKELQNGQ